MRDLALSRLSAELALEQETPLGPALSEVCATLPTAPQPLHLAIKAGARGDLLASLEALGYGRELASLMVRAPTRAHALSLRSAQVPELSLLLMPLLGLVPLLLASLLAPIVAGELIDRSLAAIASLHEGDDGLLHFLAELSGSAWDGLRPILRFVLAIGPLCFLMAIGDHRFRARLFRKTARMLEDARRLSWTACLASGGADITPALELLSSEGRARVARSRAANAEDFERLATEMLLDAERSAARSAMVLRIGLTSLGALSALAVAVHSSARFALIQSVQGF